MGLNMKTIAAIVQIQENFSHYFNDDVKSNIEVKYEIYDEVDDECGIDTIIDPLSGSDNVNNECSSTETNSISDSLMVDIKAAQTLLTFDNQKEDENSNGFGFENSDNNTEAKDDGNKVVEQELFQALEGIDKCVVDEQEEVSSTDATQDLCSLVDYWNKSVDITEGEAEADGTIETLIRALQTLDDDGTSTMQQEVTSISEDQYLCNSVPHDENSGITNQNHNLNSVTIVHDEGNDASQIISFENEEYTDIMELQVAGSKKQEQCSVDGELNEYVNLYQQQWDEANRTQNVILNNEESIKHATGQEQVELNEETRTVDPLFKSIENITVQNVNGTEIAQKELNESPITQTWATSVDSLHPSQDKQQCPASNPVDNFIFDFNKNITSIEGAVMYQVVQNSNDPTLFSILPASSNDITNLVLGSGSSATISVAHTGPLTVEQQAKLMIPCHVPLKNCLAKRKPTSSFADQKFWVGDCIKKLKLETIPAKTKTTTETLCLTSAEAPSETQVQCRGKSTGKTRTRKTRSKQDRKSKKIKGETKRQKIEKKRQFVIAAPSPPPTNQPREPEANSLILTRSATLNERKNVLINDWFQESTSSQVTSSVNNMDVNELLQDANLFTFSDIVSDLTNIYLHETLFQIQETLNFYLDKTRNRLKSFYAKRKSQASSIVFN